eukprot:tig00021217_g19334.t1
MGAADSKQPEPGGSGAVFLHVSSSGATKPGNVRDEDEHVRALRELDDFVPLAGTPAPQDSASVLLSMLQIGALSAKASVPSASYHQRFAVDPVPAISMWSSFQSHMRASARQVAESQAQVDARLGATEAAVSQAAQLMGKRAMAVKSSCTQLHEVGRLERLLGECSASLGAAPLPAALRRPIPEAAPSPAPSSSRGLPSPGRPGASPDVDANGRSPSPPATSEPRPSCAPRPRPRSASSSSSSSSSSNSSSSDSHRPQGFGDTGLEASGPEPSHALSRASPPSAPPGT